MRITTLFILITIHSFQWAQAKVPGAGEDSYWSLCPAPAGIPQKPHYSGSDIAAGHTEIRADSARIVDNQSTHFAGDVEVVRDAKAAAADEVNYDQLTHTATLEGHAHIWESGFVWRGERALFNLEDDLSRLDDGAYWLADRPGRGQAKVLKHDGQAQIARLVGVDYTTCPEDAEAWKFSASKIRLNFESDRGYATNAVLKVRNIPVFYFPYLNFPISDKRKSGFLPPSFGTTNDSGFDIRIPYYLNIAPNHDATIIPRYLADRGIMLSGEYRYMGRSFEGEVDFEYLPNDDVAEGRDRSAVSWQHEHYYDQRRGYLEALIQNVSDAQYLEDFGSGLDVTSQRYLDRRIETRYQNRHVYIYGIAQSYQLVDDTILSRFGPYRRLPQVYLSTLFPMRHLRPHFALESELTYFERDESVSGARVELIPKLTLPYIKRYAQIYPTLAVRQTQYLLNEVGEFDTNESRTVPMLSVDARLFLERRVSIFGTRFLQTLEPRLIYLYVPEVNQDRLPNFDSGLYDISFHTLFLNNRFSGRDRIGDTNQIALGLSSRFLDLDSGHETLRVSFGQIYYFEDRKIVLPGHDVLDDPTSELVTEIVVNLDNAWLARGTLQWDPNESESEKVAFNVRYQPRPDFVANAGYRFRRAVTDIEQTDLSFRIPVTKKIGLVGRWNYSLQSRQSLELLGGIEIETCCWGLRFLGRRFLRNTEGEFDTGFFFQAEFKGLAGYGRKAGSFIQRSVPGYERNF